MSSNYDLVHVRKRVSCNNSVDMLQQTCYQQADISMRLHGLRQFVDEQVCCKLSTDLLQVDC